MRSLLLTIILLAITSSYGIGQTWTLVWSDEFNGTSLNLTDWNTEIGTGSQYGLWGWGNGEEQYYTDRPENIDVSGGTLSIIAEEETYSGSAYTSARITTRYNQAWTYGRMEARMKLPTGQGIWPAFWMLPDGGPSSQVSAFWPGEIDIMEIIGSAPDDLHGTCHYGTPGNVVSRGGTHYAATGSLHNDWHLYAIEWHEDNIFWYIDDILYFSHNRGEAQDEEWLFDLDYFLLLNVAVGGAWPGSPDGSTVFPQVLEVDYIRVYQDQTNPTQNVTFSVDMSEENIGSDIVYLNGSFNNWCGTCNPMTNMGNGIWELTIPIGLGIHEYLFTTNGWAGLVESFAPYTSCTYTTVDGPNTYVNRYVNVTYEDQVLPAVCFNSCEICPSGVVMGCTDMDAINYNPSANTDDGTCLYQIEFLVDMSESGIQGGDIVNLNGTFNAWCGACDDMSDPDMDGIWSFTDVYPAGPIEFKFTTNGWSGLQEMFAEGEPCTNTTYGGGGEVFTNRFIDVNSSMTYGPVCFNSCDACPSADVNVTFKVDMFNEVLNPNGIHLNGDWVSWDPTAIPMDHLGLGIYEITIPLPGNSSFEYRFINGNTLPDQEVIAGPCTQSGNRFFNTGDVDLMLDLVCFEECDACSGCTDPLFIEFNPFAILDDGSCATNLVFGCTYSDASNYDPLANVDDGSCICAAVESCPEDVNGDGIVTTADLLALLAAFGSFCP